MVHFETILLVNEDAVRYPVLNWVFFAYLTLTFDLDMLESGFLLSVHMSGVTGRRVVHFETIRPVNEDAVRYPVLK